MEIIVNIAGGVALLLWGIRMVRTGVTRSYGGELRRFLAVSAKNRLTAAVAGLGVTTAIQSSTATAMIVSAFAGQGLITVTAAIAIMLGADVGTAIVVQIFTFDVKWLSPLLIAAGVFMFMSGEKTRVKNLGRIAIGLGLVLLSLSLIVLASVPLRETETISVLMAPLRDEPLLTVLVIAALTWFSHSSVAIILLIASFAATQVIGTQMAYVMVLGANLGGAVTAFVITLRWADESRRITAGNLTMRGVGVLIALPLIPYATPYIGEWSTNAARDVANFHLAFNIALATLFIPLIGLVQRLTEKLIPDTPVEEEDAGPRYLDAGSLETPSVALSCAARETLRMGDEIRSMLISTGRVFATNDDTLRKEIEDADDVVDTLHEAIKLYLTQLSKEELDEQESQRSIEILSFNTNLEHIGDIVDKNLMELAAKKIKGRILFSAEGAREIEDFHARIIANLDLAMSIFMSGDIELARKLIREKADIRDLERRFTDTHFSRISDGRVESIQSSALHLDVLRDLKRINGHITSVAYPILERTGELAESRLVDRHARDKAPATDEDGEPVLR